jgi:hypothetical protein
MDEFRYKIAWRARSHLPGAHRSTQQGSGFEFVGHKTLIDGADPRRLDIRASIRDPFEQWQARVFSQRSAIPVVVITDLSASMTFQGKQDKWDNVCDFTRTAAWSATRNGDLFSFIACDDQVREDLFLPATLRKSAVLDLQDRLAQLRPAPRSGAKGLLEAHRWLPQRRSLIFLVSDFHLPLEMTENLLDSLRAHDVIPVVLWDPIERQVPQGRGLLRLQDSETGRHRLIWLRPSVRDRWEQELLEHQQALSRLFALHGRPPLMIESAFNADEITHYFHAA